jgi:hypothetical protein
MPDSLWLAYSRCLQRYLTNTTYCEPTQTEGDHSQNKIPSTAQAMMDLTGRHDVNCLDFDYDKFKQLNRGENHDWSQFTVDRDYTDYQTPPEKWLDAKVDEYLDKDANGSTELQLPVKQTSNGVTEYLINDLYQDQKQVAAVILKTLEDFMVCETDEDFANFQPLRMIINGQGGCGKSVLINTLVTVFRKLFNRNDVICVLAPTGTAAFNVGGETLHRFVQQGIHNEDYKAGSMNEPLAIKLQQKFRNLLALIIDERSLLGSKLFGCCRQKITETIYNSHGKSHPWGGLPIVILVGDDYQLPPSFDTGAFHSLHPLPGSSSKAMGQSSFKECSEKVMHLSVNRRVEDDQVVTKELLEHLRVDELDENKGHVEHLMNLHLNCIEKHFGSAKKKELETSGSILHLYAYNDDVFDHNMYSVANIVNSNNPLAVVKTRSVGKKGKAVSWHFGQKDELLQSSMIAIGAIVALRGRNFCPAWGLHNGACGTVQEIIFAEGENPNTGDQPLYVAVEFPHYSGPIWDKNNPKVVPILIASSGCRFGCCSRLFLPLCLAYAKTIHKFQGLQAGPTGEGKANNFYDRIICDPGARDFESKNPGLLYTVC